MNNSYFHRSFRCRYSLGVHKSSTNPQSKQLQISYQYFGININFVERMQRTVFYKLIYLECKVYSKLKK